jgi:glycosyltransferase involved in cell wall biosynthesis
MAKKQNKIKFCLWTHIQNEAPIIKRMIESAVDYVDYIVLVDNGSTDGTQEIVREYFKTIDVPGVLYENPKGWTNPGINRQEAWEFLCDTDHGCDYILRIDADEALVVEDDFDWSCFLSGHDAYAMIFKSGDFCIPRTWVWNFNVKWRWRDDEAHEEIVLAVDNPDDEEKYDWTLIPYSCRHEARGGGNSWQDPTKYVKDVYRFEMQMLRRMEEGSNIQRERYYLFYMCRSFNYANLDIDSEWSYKFFPYGKDDIVQFLKKGIYYYNQYIEHFVNGPDWFIYYYRSYIHAGLHQFEEVARDLKVSHSHNPVRSEPVYDLYHFYKTRGDKSEIMHWAQVLKSIRLDIMKDPWDIQMDKYYDSNKNLQAEVDALLDSPALLPPGRHPSFFKMGPLLLDNSPTPRIMLD